MSTKFIPNDDVLLVEAVRRAEKYAAIAERPTNHRGAVPVGYYGVDYRVVKCVGFRPGTWAVLPIGGLPPAEVVAIAYDTRTGWDFDDEAVEDIET